MATTLWISPEADDLLLTIMFSQHSFAFIYVSFINLLSDENSVSGQQETRRAGYWC